MSSYNLRGIILIIFLFFATSVSATEHSATYRTTFTGFAGSGNSLPFWMVTNRGGIYPEHSGGLLQIGIQGTMRAIGAFRFSYGASVAGVLSKDHKRVVVETGYIRSNWRNLFLDLGMKAPECRFSGLSVSNGNILFSGNSRNFTGYNLHSNYIPLPIWQKRIRFRFNFADYQMLDKRYIRRERLHHQSVYGQIQLSSRLLFSGGIEIYGQWGGISPEYGKHPAGFKNYVRVITGSKGGKNATMSDRINVLGNQLGKKVFTLCYQSELGTTSFQYDTPFEDKSGMRFKNFPDGIYTIHHEFRDKNRWVSAFLYEFHYTKLQSGKFHDRPATPDEMADQDPTKPHYGIIILGGRDNYFNNGEYRSGWTHYGQTIGTPLMTPALKNNNGMTLGVINNRYVAHHMGMKGKIASQLPYRLLFTYSKNYGCYTQREERFDKHPQQFSLGFESQLPIKHKERYFVDWGFYADWGKLYPNRIGFSLSITCLGSIK